MGVSEQREILHDFYEYIAHSSFPFVALGTQGLCGTESYLYSSILGTLKSIDHLLKCGRLADSYSLLRRYFDTAVATTYVSLYLDEHVNPDQLVVDHINDWVRGKAKLPDFGTMCSYLSNNPRLSTVSVSLLNDLRYREIRTRCNDYVHFNTYESVMLNDSDLCMSRRAAAVRQFEMDLADIFILHFACTLLSRGQYLASSDYVDYLELGLTPPEDSEYWVAPIAMRAFDSIVVPLRPDTASLLLASSQMKLKPQA